MKRAIPYLGLGIVSAAVLLFELALTRLFAVAEWYHFAFLSIGVALFGSTAGGLAVALLGPDRARQVEPYVAAALPWSFCLAYLTINQVPFDSYQLAWQPRQYLYMAVYYLALAVPFGAGGYLVARRLATERAQSHLWYASSLLGSAVGALGLLVTMPALGGEGTVWAALALGAVGAWLLTADSRHSRTPTVVTVASSLALAAGIALTLLQPAWLSLRLSPYKALSYALQAPDARLALRRWNAYSRVDVVVAAQIHSAPGLSLRFAGALPPQHGLTVDGGDLSPISRRLSPQDQAFLRYLPLSVATALRPGGSMMVIEPRGGMDVAVALEMGASRVLAVEDNPVIVRAVRDLYGDYTGGLYSDGRVEVLVNDGRSALEQGAERLDVIVFSLAQSYHPVMAGSYGLREDYLHTVESFEAALGRLGPGGFLVVTRWAQEPPSESLRAAALALTALERLGVEDASRHILAYRSWSTVTVLATPDPWAAEDTLAVRRMCDGLGFDMVYYAGMPRSDANRFNLLQAPSDHDALAALLSASDRRAFYRAQPYEMTPPTDDRPFFGHFFRWKQLPMVLGQLGRAWQPFGGAGFLVVLALLVMALILAAALVLIPAWSQRGQEAKRWRQRHMPYFAAVGVAFMLIEIPLMQQFILYVGQPALAFILVLTTLLLFSGLGSTLAHRAPLRTVLILLGLMAALYPLLLQAGAGQLMQLDRWARAAIAIGCLAPLGLLMGVPFAGGLRAIMAASPQERAWAWAVNGSASVVGSTLAAVIALSVGYRVVLMAAACCYLLAALIAPARSGTQRF
jgi:CheY-like chemotaxis protein